MIAERDSLKTQLDATSSLQDNISKLTLDLKVEKEALATIRTENIRLKAQVELMKKRTEESNKSKAMDANTATKLKAAEEGKSKAEASVAEIRVQSIKRIEALAKMLNACC